MVYANMKRIEFPDSILVSKSVTVEIKDGKRSYTAFPHGTLTDIVDATTAFNEYAKGSTDNSVHVLCDDGKMYVFQFSQKYGWGWHRMSIETL
jgi:hypothetical protein|nr:MAG TPA: hypothetical protein [Caudoviricetes sp.]